MSDDKAHTENLITSTPYHHSRCRQRGVSFFEEASAMEETCNDRNGDIIERSHQSSAEPEAGLKISLEEDQRFALSWLQQRERLKPSGGIYGE
ncbi:hypothetical protein HHI36_003754 [Cryptolaemus montrouzieri]|uniref:Uncharacterized protein n=1 Tax=Cryptolaemus montrouzieri TaxID=559131 RepID=A0ABD2PEA8_9CUCU